MKATTNQQTLVQPLANPLTGIPSTGTKSTKKVRQLQVGIVKATQEGRWGKVKALQHLLTHSFSGKALAVRRVTENQGKKHTWS